MEIEPEGKRQDLRPGGELSWEVEWIALDVPEEVKESNEKLVSFVREIVKSVGFICYN